MHTISAYNQTRHLRTYSRLHIQAQGLGSRCGEHYADRICNMLCSCRVLIHVLAVSLGVGDDVARGARSCLGCWTVPRPHPRHPWPRIANRETGKTHRMPRRAAAPDAHIACVPKSKSNANANSDEDEGEDEDEDFKGCTQASRTTISASRERPGRCGYGLQRWLWTLRLEIS